MKLDFKRFLSSVLAVIMVFSSIAFNGTLAFADEPQPDMAITDLSVEEAPAEEAPVEEPVFINLGTPDAPALLAAEDGIAAQAAATTATWTADSLTDAPVVSTKDVYNDTLTTLAGHTVYIGKRENSALTLLPKDAGKLVYKKPTLKVNLKAGETLSVTFTGGNSGGSSGTGRTAGIYAGSIVKDITEANLKASVTSAADFSLSTVSYTVPAGTADADYIVAETGNGYYGINSVSITSEGDTPATTYTVSATDNSDNGTIVVEKDIENGTETINETNNTTGDFSIAQNSSFTLKVTPNAGYAIDNVVIGSGTVTKGATDGGTTSYTITPTADTTITVTYKELPKYSSVNVTSPAAHGTVKITKGDKEVTNTSQLTPGDTYTITVSPETGYEVESVTGATATANANEYTFTAAAADGSVDIVITYKEKATEPDTPTGSTKTYNFTSAGGTDTSDTFFIKDNTFNDGTVNATKVSKVEGNGADVISKTSGIAYIAVTLKAGDTLTWTEGATDNRTSALYTSETCETVIETSNKTYTATKDITVYLSSEDKNRKSLVKSLTIETSGTTPTPAANTVLTVNQKDGTGTVKVGETTINEASGTATLTQGTAYEVTITPPEGFEIATVTGDNIKLADGKYTYTAPTAETDAITVTYKASAKEIEVPVTVAYTGKGTPIFTITATPATVSSRGVVEKTSVGKDGTTLSLWNDTEYTITVTGLGTTFNAATVDPAKLTPVTDSKITVTVTDAPVAPTGTEKTYVFGSTVDTDDNTINVTSSSESGQAFDDIVVETKVKDVYPDYFRVNHGTPYYIAVKLNAGDKIALTIANNEAAIYSDATCKNSVAGPFDKSGEFTATTDGTYYISSAGSGNSNIQKMVYTPGKPANPITVTLAENGGKGTVAIKKGDAAQTPTEGKYTLTQGTAYTVVITAPEGYKIASVTSKESGNLTATDGVYSYKAPAKTEDTITVTYEAIPTHTVTINVTNPSETVAASAPTVKVNGAAATLTGTASPYTLTAKEGSKIEVAAADVDGYNATVDKSSFTLSADTTVNITYAEKPAAPAATTWNAGDPKNSWLSVSGTSATASPDTIVFEDDTTYTKTDKSVKIARSTDTHTGTFTITAPAGSSAKIYLATISNNKGTVTVTDSTGAPVTCTDNVVSDKANKIDKKANVIEVAFDNGGTYTVTIEGGDSKGYQLFKVELTGEMEPFTVAGKVTAADGTAIAGANVVASTGETATTAADGTYAFTTEFKAPVTLTVTAAGYIGQKIGPFSSTTTTADAKLAQAGAYTVTVNVKDSANAALEGATVTLTNLNGEIKGTMTTDATGKVEFTGITGATNVTVTKDGYSTYTEQLAGTESTYTVDATITNKITVKFAVHSNSDENASEEIKFHKGLLDSASDFEPSGSEYKIKTAKFSNPIKAVGSSYTFEGKPGDVISFYSQATNVYAWQAFRNENGIDTRDSKSCIKFINGFKTGYLDREGKNIRFFTYTVPADAKPGSTYGVYFLAGSKAKGFDTDAAYGQAIDLNGDYTIGYGSYGFGHDKIGTNAGLVSGDEPYALTEAQINYYSPLYSAREHLDYALGRPSMADMIDGAVDTTYNVVANDATKYRVVNDNLYAILDADIKAATIADADTGLDNDVQKSFIMFHLDVPGKDEVDVVVDATTGSSTYTIQAYPDALSGNATPADWKNLKGDPDKGKTTFTLKTGYTYVILDNKETTNQKTYIKSIRIFNNDNVFATMKTEDTAGTNTVTYTPMDANDTTHPNIKVESMGTAAEVATNNTALATALGLDKIDQSLNIYRLVARVNVPAGAKTAEQFVASLDNVGFDVYDTAAYNTEEAADDTRTNHLNHNNTPGFAPKETITFTQTNSSVVAPTTDLAGMGYPYKGVTLEYGAISSTNLADVYVQTYFATNTSLTLVPFTKTQGGTAYTSIPLAEQNIAKVIGTTN